MSRTGIHQRWHIARRIKLALAPLIALAIIVMTGANVADAESRVEVIPVSGQFLDLAADGSRAVTVTDVGFCVTDLTTSEELTCFDRTTLGLQALDLESITISPDGTLVAFTESYFQFLYEPDIFVFEVERGQARALTDDGVATISRATRLTPALIDTAPTWSSNSQALYFARTVISGRSHDAEATDLYRVAVDGGDPEFIVTLTEAPTAIPYSAMRLLPDGEGALYAVYDPTGATVENGLWRVAFESGERERLLGPTSDDDDFDALYPLAISADGDQALVLNLRRLQLILPEPYLRLDLTTGETTALSVAGGSATIRAFGFQPDTDRIVALVSDGSNRLVSIDRAGAVETLVDDVPPHDFGGLRGFALHIVGDRAMYCGRGGEVDDHVIVVTPLESTRV